MIDSMALTNGVVVALLALIATIDIAQFTVALRQERRLTRLEVHNGPLSHNDD